MIRHLALGFVTTVLLLSSVRAESNRIPQERFIFDPPVSVGWVGDTVEIYISIDTGIQDASFFRSKIQFDTTLMRVDTILPAQDWLSAAGSSFNQFFSYKDSLDPALQEWYYDVFGSLAGGRTIDGYAHLARIRFVLEQGGQTELGFLFTRLEGIDLQEIPAWALNGELTICPLAYTAADLNNDGVPADPVDLSYMVDFFFSGGPEPQPDILAGDLNCDLVCDPVDLSYFVDFLFSGGPPPCDVCQTP